MVEDFVRSVGLIDVVLTKWLYTFEFKGSGKGGMGKETVVETVCEARSWSLGKC